MAVYKARPGVVLLEVCGEAMLVATGEARGHCPNITHINAAGAVLWKLLTEEKTMERVLSLASETLSLSPGEAFLSTLRYTHKLTESGYLLQEEAT